MQFSDRSQKSQNPLWQIMLKTGRSSVVIPYKVTYMTNKVFKKKYVKKSFRNFKGCLSSSQPSVAYIPQWIIPSSILIMASRLFRAKPLFELMLSHC